MISGALLDAVLILVFIAYAVMGYRQGLVAAALSVVGFLGGALLGMWLVPLLLGQWQLLQERPTLSALIAVIIVFVIASLGQALMVAVGKPLRESVQSRTSTRVNAVLGSIAVLVTTAVFTWLIAGVIRPAAPPSVARAIGSSSVLATIDKVMPQQATAVVTGLGDLLNRGGFPQVFEGFQSEPIIDVAPPPAGVAKSKQVLASKKSIVRITGIASGCERGQEGTGWVISRQRVVTNAHVVAGLREVNVDPAGSVRSLRGTVVAFDPKRDLAIIDVPELDAPPLKLGRPAAPNDESAVAGYPLNGPFTIVPSRVRAELEATGADIYGNPGVSRKVYSLYAVVKPGNSGGPLLDANGRVVGVVFARSLDDASTGYALTLAEAKPVLDRAASAKVSVSTGRCISGG